MKKKNTLESRVSMGVILSTQLLAAQTCEPFQWRKLISVPIHKESSVNL